MVAAAPQSRMTEEVFKYTRGKDYPCTSPRTTACELPLWMPKPLGALGQLSVSVYRPLAFLCKGTGHSIMLNLCNGWFMLSGFLIGRGHSHLGPASLQNARLKRDFYV